MVHVIVDTTTGRLTNVGTVAPARVDASETALTFDRAMPDFATEMWDTDTRTFIARPAAVLVDRLDDLAADPDFIRVTADLNAARQADLRAALIRWIGPRNRYRKSYHSAVLESGQPEDK